MHRLDYIKLQQSPQAAWLPERAASSWSALTDATPRLQIAIEDGDEKEGMDEPEPPHATQSMLMELKVKEYYENFMKENRVSGTDAVLFLISVLTFCADVGLDIHLTINYLRQVSARRIFDIRQRIGNKQTPLAIFSLCRVRFAGVPLHWL